MSLEMHIWMQKGGGAKDKKKVNSPILQKDQTDQGRIKNEWNESHKPIRTSINNK